MMTVELERPLQTSVRRRPHASVGPVDEIAALFPPVRRCDPAVPRPARRRAPAFDACASPTAWIVAEGLALLDDAGRRRVTDGWRSRRRGPGAGLVVDGGCDVRVGRVPLGPAAREALLQWLPPSRLELTLFDGGLFADDPVGAIALLVRPPTIWPLEEAVRAERLFPRGPLFEPERFAALELYARGHVRENHTVRLRGAVRRVAAQLQVAGLPTASATVAAGCALIATDDDRCRAVAARQLARYASSTVVGVAAGSGDRSRSMLDLDARPPGGRLCQRVVPGGRTVAFYGSACAGIRVVGFETSRGSSYLVLVGKRAGTAAAAFTLNYK